MGFNSGFKGLNKKTTSIVFSNLSFSTFWKKWKLMKKERNKTARNKRGKGRRNKLLSVSRI